jgi:hypothetical protein
MGKIPGLDKTMKDMYTKLDEEMQQQFGEVPEILEKDPVTWTEQEKEMVNAYSQYCKEEELDDDAGSASASKPKPKPKPKPTKSTSKPASASASKSKTSKK